ncbi:c-type cytochrome [Defluviimonas salinarum]|uniref:Cytochrome c n=1 Tax=Defluviimonas salinarum TaxID=2992147 RepID=A0ABT3J5A2_9RHOB|nr:cytochrome c [Defluviimonas salinarum]MCW3782869.1 cytochrome c [Defluviimonas salinarum]
MKAGLATVLALSLAVIAAAAWYLPRGPVAEDVAAGERLYAENCASCHGADLEGQPDWRTPGPDGRLPAPPHDESGHTWHHGDGMLFSYTKLGGKAALAARGVKFDSGMPGFADALSDRQIRDILAYIRSTWPDRQREVQAARTAAERLEGDTGE